jgi:hypothetical protein
MEIGTGELAPATVGWRCASRAAEPEHCSDQAGDAQGDEGSTDHRHSWCLLGVRRGSMRMRGASWNRTSDLTLIRGAL